MSAEGTRRVADDERIHGVPVTWSQGDKVVHPDRSQYLDLARSLREDGFNYLADLCAVDYLTHGGRRALPPGLQPGRFEIVVNLLSMSSRQRLRIRVQVPQADPAVPTLFWLYPGSEAMEREAFDLFGIRFEGHPDMTRILMPEDWEGHPLRKDYSAGRVPIQFKAAPGPR